MTTHSITETSVNLLTNQKYKKRVKKKYIWKCLQDVGWCVLGVCVGGGGGGGGGVKNAYKLLILRGVRFPPVNEIHIFQCMGKIFCTNFNTKFKFKDLRACKHFWNASSMTSKIKNFQFLYWKSHILYWVKKKKWTISFQRLCWRFYCFNSSGEVCFQPNYSLTYCGLVIFVKSGSGEALLLPQSQAIAWTNADFLSIWIPKEETSMIFLMQKNNSNLFKEENVLKSVFCRISAIQPSV